MHAPAASHIEHEIRGRDVGELHQLGEGGGLHQVARRIAARGGRDLDVLVDIGEVAAACGNESLARHGQHGVEQRGAGDVGRAHLAVDHAYPPLGVVCFHYQPGPSLRRQGAHCH